jgi:DNA-binding NtrC family response regulator
VKTKKILIIDEERFAKVCSALLEVGGYVPERLECLDEIDSRFETHDYDLVVTSYPYGARFFDRIRNKKIPVLVLLDFISREIIEDLKKFKNSCCMIKPIDFEKLNNLIEQMTFKGQAIKGEFRIV